jgi:hypothetical protein
VNHATTGDLVIVYGRRAASLASKGQFNAPNARFAAPTERTQGRKIHADLLHRATDRHPCKTFVKEKHSAPKARS